MREVIISEGYVGLWCDYTLCYRLPALPDWLRSDCDAVVHDLGLQIVMGKVMGVRVLQWSVGAVGEFQGWTSQARGVQGQQAQVHLA